MRVSPGDVSLFGIAAGRNVEVTEADLKLLKSGKAFFCCRVLSWNDYCLVAVSSSGLTSNVAFKYID